MAHMYSKFVGWRSSHTKWLENILKLRLLWDVLWPLGFAYFSLQYKFSQIYVRNALMFAFSDNPIHTTSSITKSHSFCNFFKSRGELVCGAQISKLIWSIDGRTEEFHLDQQTISCSCMLWSRRIGNLLQMNRLSLRKNRLKFKIAFWKLPIILEEFIEYTQFNKGKPEDVNM